MHVPFASHVSVGLGHPQLYGAPHPGISVSVAPSQ